jgi:uncharacterized secreted protein with C-terminal beta-propeller domain
VTIHRANARPTRNAALSVVLLAAATAAGTLPATGATRPATASYQRFTSCERFLAYLRPEAERQVGPYGFDGGGWFRGGVAVDGPVAVPLPATAGAPATTAAPAVAPAPAQPVVESPAFPTERAAAGAANSSGTNTQEAGIDEGDLAENDGRHVYVATARAVQVVDTKTPGTTPAGTVTDRTPRVIATIPLPANASSSQLILAGPRLAVITSAFTNAGPETAVSIYDVGTPSAPRFLARRYLEGQSVSARSVEGRVRLVLQTDLGTRLRPRFVQPDPARGQRGIDEAVAANRRVVRRASAADWLPRTYAENADGSTGPIGQALSCAQVGRPEEFSGLAVTWIATVSLDPASPRPPVEGAAGVVGSGSVVYASSDTLYVATTSWAARFPVPVRVAPGVAPVPPRPRPITTSIHAFLMDTPDGARWLASGRVPGQLLNQFAMSEWEGVFRVATTEFDAGFGGTSSSTVRTMGRAGRTLVQIGSLGGLGRNERIYAVRYVGDLAFVVTFRQVDPLYVLDLSNPRALRLTGELKIPGFSSYLHPIGNGLLLGLGQDADANGRVLGTQLSVFDVNDRSNPRRVSQLTLGGSSEAETNHLAFLWWGPTRDAVIPSMTFPRFDPQGRAVTVPQIGAAVVRIGAAPVAELTQRGRVTHPSAFPPGDASAPVTTMPPGRGVSFDPIQRSMIVDGALVTVSQGGVLVTDLTSLAPTGWATYLAP